MKEEKKKTLREQQEPQKRFLFFLYFIQLIFIRKCNKYMEAIAYCVYSICHDMV